MQAQFVTRKSFEEAAKQVVKDQWVEFHWSADNPNIAADVRVLPCADGTCPAGCV